MKTELIGILKLKTGASEAQIVSAVSEMAIRDAATSASNIREKAIADKIADSCGAMTREIAINALDMQSRLSFKR